MYSVLGKKHLKNEAAPGFFPKMVQFHREDMNRYGSQELVQITNIEWELKSRTRVLSDALLRPELPIQAYLCNF